MGIFNKTELAALAVSRIPVGVNAGTSAQNIQDQLTDERDSADRYAAVISGDGGTLNLTTALQDVTTYSTALTSANDIFAPDVANNRIRILQPCLVNLNMQFQGEWASNDDITFELWVIDNNNPTGIKHAAWTNVTQSGSGVARRVDMYKSRTVPMSDKAPFLYDFTGPVYIYMRAKSSGTTTVTQVHIELAPVYEVFTVRSF